MYPTTAARQLQQLHADCQPGNEDLQLALVLARVTMHSHGQNVKRKEKMQREPPKAAGWRPG